MNRYFQKLTSGSQNDSIVAEYCMTTDEKSTPANGYEEFMIIAHRFITNKPLAIKYEVFTSARNTFAAFEDLLNYISFAGEYNAIEDLEKEFLSHGINKRA